ncbi:MAG TPA: hypothetical protein VD866_14370 [Urbifossiella sp.]|nr:hypothetical protein [Urbifossiella sp.]
MAAETGAVGLTRQVIKVVGVRAGGAPTTPSLVVELIGLLAIPGDGLELYVLGTARISTRTGGHARSVTRPQADRPGSG